MANPIRVKGIRAIVDVLGDEVMQAAAKGAKLPAGAAFTASGEVTLDGTFGFDRKGDFGFVGNGATMYDLPALARHVLDAYEELKAAANKSPKARSRAARSVSAGTLDTATAAASSIAHATA